MCLECLELEPSEPTFKFRPKAKKLFQIALSTYFTPILQLPYIIRAAIHKIPTEKQQVGESWPLFQSFKSCSRNAAMEAKPILQIFLEESKND